MEGEDEEEREEKVHKEEHDANGGMKNEEEVRLGKRNGKQ